MGGKRSRPRLDLSHFPAPLNRTPEVTQREQIFMKRGLYGQQLNLMEELKAETFQAHSRIQTLPFFQALAACQLPLESYVGQLRDLAVIHGVLEQALDQGTDARVAAVWRPDLRKLPLLQQDLRYFEPRAVSDLKEAVDVALQIAERIRRWLVSKI